jgi:hypothetical protein
MDTELREQQAMDQVVHRLIASFENELPPERVTSTVTRVYRQFDNRPIREFVPMLVERFVREELRVATPTAPQTGAVGVVDTTS